MKETDTLKKQKLYGSDEYQREKRKQGKEIRNVGVGRVENLDTWAKVTVLGRIMALQRCPWPNPFNVWICQVTWQRELKLLISWPWDGENSLGDPDGSNLIIRVLTNGRRNQKGESERWQHERGLAWHWGLWRWEGAPSQGIWLASKKVEKARKLIFP